MSLIEVRSLVTELWSGRSLVPIVRGVSFTVNRGEVLGIVGESGSGKTVTARTLVRLLPRNAKITGQVMFDGVDVLSLDGTSLREFRARRSAMIFQDPRAHMHPLYRCGDYLDEGLVVHRGLARSIARAESLGLLRAVGITDPERVYKSYPGELSGGMLQRVLIAGALTMAPDFLIADEPTTALDVTIQAEIMAILDSLRKERDLACLFITHDLDLASMMCDRIVVMYAGLIVESRRTDDLFDQPLHPYTWGLLRARPLIENRRKRLSVIPGRPPIAGEFPEGCPFHPRCIFAEDACKTTPPELRAVGSESLTACRRSEALIAGNMLSEDLTSD